MAEGVEAGDAATERVTCLYCGAEIGDAPSPVKGLCVPCAARVLPARPAKQGVNGHSVSLPRSGHEPERRASPKATHLREAIDELADVPASVIPAKVNELLAVDKRVLAFIALIPFVGPWLLQRSDAHSDREKRILTWISLALTGAILGALVWMIPTNTTMLSRLQARMQREMTVLVDVAERYRSEHGSYPDASVWRRYAERADPRFYDPWGRPYLYDATDEGISLRSLGRDGVAGGSDEEADMSAAFPQATVRK
jgi:hypothetical protein